MATQFIALFADTAAQVSILATGATADEAISTALSNIGGDLSAEDLVAQPITPRLGALLDMGYDMKSWTTRDGKADVSELSFAMYSNRSGDGFENFYGEHESREDRPHAAAVAILRDCRVNEPADYVVISYPSILAINEILDEDGDLLEGVEALIEVFDVEVDADDLADEEEDGEEDDDDLVSLINGIHDYADEEIRLMTENTVNLSGKPHAQVCVYRKSEDEHHETFTYEFQRRVYVPIKAGQEWMNASNLLTAATADA